MVKLRPIVMVMFLAAVITITGCASAASYQVTSTPTAANNTGGAQLSTPLSQPTSTLPATKTATRVVDYPATNIPVGTPTISPTSTLPVPLSTSTPEPQVGSPLPQAIEHVVLISIDGLRPDALELANTPTLDALRRAGAYSPKAQAVLPSVTLVNHASMLSGMAPANTVLIGTLQTPAKVKSMAQHFLR